MVMVVWLALFVALVCWLLSADCYLASRVANVRCSLRVGWWVFVAGCCWLLFVWRALFYDDCLLLCVMCCLSVCAVRCALSVVTWCS